MPRSLQSPRLLGGVMRDRDAKNIALVSVAREHPRGNVDPATAIHFDGSDSLFDRVNHPDLVAGMTGFTGMG